MRVPQLKTPTFSTLLISRICINVLMNRFFLFLFASRYASISNLIVALILLSHEHMTTFFGTLKRYKYMAAIAGAYSRTQ